MASDLDHRLNTKQTFLLFLLFAIVFHLDKILLGPYAPIRMHDNFEVEYGRYLQLGNLILEYGLFFWNPHMAGGMPSFAYHYGPLNLMVLLSTIFPLWLMYHFLVILLMTLAGYGMYLFIQTFTDTPQKFILLGGLLFALNTQLTMASLTFMPFIFVFPFFFFCLHSSSNASFWTNTLVSRFFWLIIFSWVSYPTITIAFPALHLALIFWLTPKQQSRKTWLYQFSLYWVGYSLLFLPSVFTLLDFIPFHHRAYPEVIYFSDLTVNHFYQFLGFAWHDVFLRQSITSLSFPILVASIPLIFVSREVRKYAYLIILLISLAGISGSSLSGLYTETFLGKIEIRLIFFILPFVMTFYAVAAIKTLSQQSDKIRFLCMGLAIVALLYIFNLDRNCCALSPNAELVFKILNTLVTLGVFLYLDSVFLAAMTSPSSKKIIRNTAWALLLFVFIGTLGFSKLERFIAMENKIYKRHFESSPVFRALAEKPTSNPFRVAMIGNRPTIAGTYGLEYTGGRGPLYNKYYKDYFKLLVWPQLKNDPKLETFFDNYNYQLYMQVDKQSHPEFKYNLKPNINDWNLSLLLATNIKYVISNRIIIGMNRYAKSIIIDNGEWYSQNSSWILKPWEVADKIISSFELMRTGPIGRRREPVRYFIYEMKDHFERAYLTSETAILSTRQDVLKALGNATIEDLEDKAYLVKEDIDGLENLLVTNENQIKSPEQLKFLNYKPDRMTMEVITKGPRVLIISTNYDPKWKAVVNNQETKIIRTNHAFQGIFLPVSGKYKIELNYSDPILSWTFIAIPFGVLLVFTAARLKINSLRV